MLRRASCVLITACLCFLTLSGYSNETVDHQKFESYVEKLIEEFSVPGLAVGVVSADQEIYMKGFGVRDIESQKPVTPQTQFAIGSTTKAFTATALGTLVDRGVVEWDRPIKSSYLPDFELMDPAATELMTIRDLLTHRSGLPRHDLVWYGSPLSREEIYHRLKYLQPTAGIREKVQYQNLMFMTAGYLTGQVTNSTWEGFVAQEIFQPLGMNNSNFSVRDMQQAPDFANPHAVANGQAQVIPFRSADAIGPAGSINSSVSDMGRWLQLQLNGGQFEGTRIIRGNALAEVHAPQMVSHVLGFTNKYDEFGVEHYSMGWLSQTYHDEWLVHHGGGIDGFITFVGFLPEHNVGIVVVGNASGNLVPYAAGFAYMDLLLKGKVGPWEQRLKELTTPPEPNPVEPTQSPLPVESYIGTYTHPAYGEVNVTLGKAPESLVFAHYVATYHLGHYQNDSWLPMLPTGKLMGNQEPVEFVKDSRSTISSLLWKADDKADPVKFQRVDSKPSVLRESL